MTTRVWTDDEVSYFREIVPMHHMDEIRDLFEKRFGVRLSVSQVKNAKTRYGVHSRTIGGQYKLGHSPANKGKTWEEQGLSEEKQAAMRRTCFKPGDVPPNLRPIGSERISQGYVLVKVADSFDPDGYNDWRDLWRYKHVVEWEKANGRRLPDGYAVAFADHNRRNFDPENLVAVTHGQMAVISHKRVLYHDRETLESALAIADLDHRLNELACHARVCNGCGKVFHPEWPKQRNCRKCIDERKAHGRG